MPLAKQQQRCPAALRPAYGECSAKADQLFQVEGRSEVVVLCASHGRQARKAGGLYVRAAGNVPQRWVCLITPEKRSEVAA